MGLSVHGVGDFVFESAHFLKGVRVGVFEVGIYSGEYGGDEANVMCVRLRDHFGGGAVGDDGVEAEVGSKVDGLLAICVGVEAADGPGGFHGGSFGGLGMKRERKY